MFIFLLVGRLRKLVPRRQGNSLGDSVLRSTADEDLFILAHPDDEVVFSPILDRLVREGKHVRVIYLTNGGSGVASEVRSAETVRALGALGISASDIFFAGQENGIPDGRLYLHLHSGLEALEDWCRSLESVDRIYTLAWEGGHADHDAAHLVAAVFAGKHGLSDRMWQVPFYRASDKWPAPFFTLGSPLLENGPVVSLPLSARERGLPVSLIGFYRSQWRSFAGLGPFILWRFLTRNALLMQRIRYERLGQRPTASPLLYEMRNGMSFDEFQAATAPFLARHLEARSNRVSFASYGTGTA